MTSRDGLGLVSLGARAGSVVVGTGGVRAGLQRDEIALVVVARDASPRTDDKVVRLARMRGIPLTVVPSARRLGESLGRSSVQVVGIRDRHLADGIRLRMPVEGS